MMTVDPPLQSQVFGIGTWTKGALDAAIVEISETSEVHGDNTYVVVLITDEIAAAGGTLEAFEVALDDILDVLITEEAIPDCSP